MPRPHRPRSRKPRPAPAAPPARRGEARPVSVPPSDAADAQALRDIDDARFATAWFGTHLVCPNRGCRRAGRCLDDDPARMPRCFHHYRGTIFLLMELFAAQHGLAPADPAAPPRRDPHRGPSLLGALAAAGEPTEPFRRPAGSGPDDYDCRDDPEALELFEDLRAEAGRRG